MADDTEWPHSSGASGNTQSPYESLFNSARAFHEFVFRAIGSSAIVALLQAAAFRSKSAILLFLLAMAYLALAAFIICFARFVLFASFERRDAVTDGRAALLWLVAGLVTGLVLALPSVFSRVVAVLLKQGVFL